MKYLRQLTMEVHYTLISDEYFVSVRHGIDEKYYFKHHKSYNDIQNF